MVLNGERALQDYVAPSSQHCVTPVSNSRKPLQYNTHSQLCLDVILYHLRLEYQILKLNVKLLTSDL